MNFWKMSGCWFRISGMGLGESERVLQQKRDLQMKSSDLQISPFFSCSKGNSRGEEGWTWGRFHPLTDLWELVYTWNTEMTSVFEG